MCELEFNSRDVESHKGMKYTDEEKTTILRKYVCCAEVWKGLFLMFFYQFAGYNVVSFYATSILNHPKETEEELIHPNKTNNFVHSCFRSYQSIANFNFFIYSIYESLEIRSRL